MKKLIWNGLLALTLMAGYGCDSNPKASTETAASDNASGAGETSTASTDTAGSATAAVDTTINETPTSTPANDFMLTAASGGMLEVTLGQMAQEKGSSADVKAFGQKMIEDHGKANAELKTLAASKNVTLPVKPLAEHQKHIDEMSKLSGADFDKHYMSMMVTDHQKDVAEFEKASKMEDPDVKGFATKTLPVLKSHLEMAQKANGKVAAK
jgi:putative membrane protein